MTLRTFTPALAAAGLLAATATSALAQQATQAEPLAVGSPAPEFAVVGATAEGVLEDSVRLSDFRGHTLVIAFFYRARTPG